MKLLRVQVPDFRILKNVDITFEPEFIPSIFPLGSQNGGGKSTLLQLIFILLHCSSDSEKKDFVKNILYGFTINNNSNKRVLAIIDIWNDDKIIQLEFLSYNDSYLRELLISNDKTEIDNDNYRQLSVSSNKLDRVINKISTNEKEIQDLERAIIKLDNVRKIESSEERRYVLGDLKQRLQRFEFRTLRLPIANISIERFQDEVQTRLDISKLNLEKYYEEREQLESILQRVLKYLQLEKLLYICNYSANGNKDEEEVLLCHIDNIDMNEVETFMKELSQKIFLAAPSTQVFLFNSKESRKLLFKEQDNETDYYSQLKLAKSKLSGFFTYDFLAVDILIEAFKSARDKDFAEAIKKGEYGNSYKALINDLNIIIFNKKINIDTDLSGVSFKLDKDGLELYPEDLSHGELKRLSIYIWIKYHNIENAIVLMDEIEIAFHPDWQYQIIADINQWAPSNQYILATHSYELCQALTPAHVKELEPKLLKPEAKN
ncbi:ATP-binding protein [Nostoc sp. 'Peltigera membranacea cyanobiont' 210A]|uniref:AAA family ATPase n=1 Tax=Nostoc sp. 'Peltigera membranacea cyanobiont' 210A TaxID=2014529 RepID=UPI000B951444|nr:AAA family ATPase [Nostoc sp. 'Peltigera membranacea cyanobiont' 210A]OYD92388.1 ATP-binding protein [Nostoc sp. 'Peltigera membranacea cyanobiont' 210A]